jgi:hypothetical protein
MATQGSGGDSFIKKQFQKTTSKLMKASIDQTAMIKQALDGKLRSWSIPPLPGRRARQAMERLRSLAGRIPPRCHLAILRTMCNGWIVQRRLGY